MAYELRDSPFFRLRSKAKLADLLFISVEKLESLANLTGSYYEFEKAKKSGGVRNISAPVEPLKQVQKRIAVLLQRITPPDYLFAPVSGRSYVDNAARHIGAQSVRLLDIEDFFPSCSVKKAAWLFANKLECSPDVAAILCKLVTLKGALPQGSPASPILAYLCYLEMWSEIQQLVEEAGCTLSVYADDLTISGDLVREEMIWKVKRTLFRHGHRYSREKERSRRGRPVEVTGVILRREGVAAPNRQHQRIHELREELRHATVEEAAHLKRKLTGRVAQLRQIRAGNEPASPKPLVVSAKG
ncbi:MAG: reverse transcriptase family protein [Brevundimonas sp.]|uniref:reverse transcriptase family protein n=1 Tax=Brevundimonas sp. TaxID=1871086 RepID=UPI002734953C|nr:reverse transcriptase family protein [Brevundimonas sp.]MDP3657729.1 reverse transcriptase family protein [Brevundimonas sp.]